MVKRYTRHKNRPLKDSTEVEVKDDHYVDQKSQCEECQRKKVKITYRPLVNDNGSFLCDECYKTLYPATAMYENDENILSKINQKIRDKRAQKTYPEEEECHACLEHGKYRRCCKRYYCRSCYYESGSCPGCDKPCHRSGVTLNQQRPSKLAVLATWGISVSLLLIVIGFISATVTNMHTKPHTVWGHTCHGWFPRCEKAVCVDFKSSDPSSGMPTQYELCTVNETYNKVTGNACIFDPELYRWSDKSSGYDLCIDNEMDEKTDGLQGVYIFEDNFDYWIDATHFKPESVMMKSAKWAHVVNAKASDICGVNKITRPYEREHGDFITSRKNASLVFSGVSQRYAETQTLDVRFGGNIEFYLKLAPVVDNELTTECKTAFVGGVILSYSINDGFSWESIRTYPVWKYRNEYFQFVKEDIPEAAITNATRFRWSQTVFDPQRDYWALDDVRVFSYIDPSFEKSTLYRTKIDQREANVMQQQCLHDTEQCAYFPNEKRSSGRFRLRSVDIYLSICCVILVFRKGFDEFHEWSTKRHRGILRQEHDKNQVANPLKKRFNYDVSKSWQIFAFSMVILPLLSISIYIAWHILHWWSFYSKDTLSSLYLILSFAMDFWALRMLCRDVLHYWPCLVEQRVEVDATTEAEMLIVTNKKIPLLEVQSVSLASRELQWALFGSVCVSAFPFSSAMIFIKAMNMTYKRYVLFLHLLGISSLCRSLLGPTFFVEFFLAVKFVSSLSEKDRDEMGRAFGRPSVAHTTANATIFTLVIIGPYFLYTFRRYLDALSVIAILIGTVFVGTLTGSLIGLLRGLPIVPRIHLTTWPHDGYQFKHTRMSKAPHLLSKFFGGGMNSCEVYLIHVTEIELFRSMLSGNVGVNILLSDKSYGSDNLNAS